MRSRVAIRGQGRRDHESHDPVTRARRACRARAAPGAPLALDCQRREPGQRCEIDNPAPGASTEVAYEIAAEHGCCRDGGKRISNERDCRARRPTSGGEIFNDRRCGEQREEQPASLDEVAKAGSRERAGGQQYSDSRRRCAVIAPAGAVGLAKTDHPPSPDVACHPSRSRALASGELRVVNAHPMS